MDRGEMGMVQVADCLEAALNKRGYVYVMDIGPRMVGFDPVNRDGEGGNTQQVLKLAEDIWEVGFSWEATRHATCVEVIPGTRDVEIFNQKFFRRQRDGCGAVEQHPLRQPERRAHELCAPLHCRRCPDDQG
jgi:hypothetical protein